MASFLPSKNLTAIVRAIAVFSSLSESGFIPTELLDQFRASLSEVLISFREWLHSYVKYIAIGVARNPEGSHLFQRVASFLLVLFKKALEDAGLSSHLFQRVASFLLLVTIRQNGR